MGTYHRPTAAVPAAHAQEAAAELSLPESVVISLVDLAGAAKEGLLALAMGTGLETLPVLLEESVAAVAGPKGKHNPERAAVRHGSEAGSVTLGGRGSAPPTAVMRWRCRPTTASPPGTS